MGDARMPSKEQGNRIAEFYSYYSSKFHRSPEEIGLVDVTDNMIVSGIDVEDMISHFKVYRSLSMFGQDYSSKMDQIGLNTIRLYDETGRVYADKTLLSHISWLYQKILKSVEISKS